MKLAKILSYIFHPIFMPLVGLAIIFNSGIYESDLPGGYMRFLFLIVLLCNVMLPVSIIPVLIYIRHIQNLNIDERRERIIPLFFAAICFYIGYYLVALHSHSQLINLFMLTATAIVIVVLLVSLFWKISLHMTGVGGITGLIIILSYLYRADILILFCIAILISGIIASARLASGSHNPLQILAGYLLGLLGVLGLMFQFSS
jgi:membrane-associated phospholipid phosphatase